MSIWSRAGMHGSTQLQDLVVLVDVLLAILQAFQEGLVVCVQVSFLSVGVDTEVPPDPCSHRLVHKHVCQVRGLPLRLIHSERPKAAGIKSFLVSMDDATCGSKLGRSQAHGR